MNRKLIIDVGMHIGKDTEFYLKKGFRVVGIEADLLLVQQVEKRLSSYIADGSLIILNTAIANFDGVTDFYANREHNDWGTLSLDFVQRNEEIFGSKHEKIRVNCMRFENVLNDYGVPYYLKVDIEGAELLCLRALLPMGTKPKYVSIEASLTSFEDAFTELSLMWQLDYRHFKIVNQALNHTVKCPKPPLEGNYVKQLFDDHSSGPFGEEAPGKWLSIAETIDRYRSILKLQSWFGGQGKYYNTILHKIYNVYSKVTTGEPVGWYDFHCKLTNR